MHAVTAHLVLTFVVVMGLFTDNDFWSTTFSPEDYGPISDLSFASADALDANPDNIFGDENASDLSLDLPFVSAEPFAFDYFHPDEDFESWDDGLSTLSADAENSNCIPGENQLPARVRARDGTCAAPSTIDPPTVYDLSDPSLKLKPICPMEEFPFYPIAVCSSGDPLDEWGPSNSRLLYDSEQGESISTPSQFRGSKEKVKVLKRAQ